MLLSWSVFEEKYRAGITPMALASIAGKSELIRMLVAASADVNHRLSNGETALMLTARTGDVDAIEALLDLGAEIDAAETLRGRQL